MSELSVRERISIVLAGHVDHGKSTIVGRLLADSGALPEGKLAQVQEYCRRHAKPFEYAFLIDALKNEQAQGVTIDSARVFFRQGEREYILIDAPGHIEFVRNMVSGASRADAALLVVDAAEGIRENSRRHAALLALLGVRQIILLVNKMDLVGWSQQVFDRTVKELADHLAHWGLQTVRSIPVSGTSGANIVNRGGQSPWYSRETLLETLAALQGGTPPIEKQFRMWVQDVYKFTEKQDTRRIIAGTICSGTVNVGDAIIFHPSGKKSTVQTLEAFNAPGADVAVAGMASGFTLSEQIYVARGELATRTDQPKPRVTSRLRVSLFWLSREPMAGGKRYTLKIGTARVGCRIETIHHVQDGSSLELKKASAIGRHEIADCDLQLERPMAFDLAEDIAPTGRFVIVDDYEIRGGGTIREALEDRQSTIREKVLLRDYKWETSTIAAEERAAKFGQKPALVLITGARDSGKKPLARMLESRLLAQGHLAYFLGIGNILYGVDADIKGRSDDRREHIRRLAEVAHIMLGAGFILVVTAIDLHEDELALIRTTVDEDQIITVWRGGAATDLSQMDISLAADETLDVAAGRVLTLLAGRGILPVRTQE